jgi:hypothetical protein
LLSLSFGVFDFTVVERGKIPVEVRERSAVGTSDATLAFELGQISARSGFRDVELFTNF